MQPINKKLMASTHNIMFVTSKWGPWTHVVQNEKLSASFPVLDRISRRRQSSAYEPLFLSSIRVGFSVIRLTCPCGPYLSTANSDTMFYHRDRWNICNIFSCVSLAHQGQWQASGAVSTSQASSAVN